MNNGDSYWDRSLKVDPPTPISANPWSDPKSSSNLVSSSNDTLILPPISPARGRASSIASGTGTTTPSETGDQSVLRPRARLRRLRSDLGDTSNGHSNESPSSAGIPQATPNMQDIRPRSITPSTSTYKRRKSPTEPLPTLHTSSSGDFDWDEDDKTREGKARKQGKSALRTALPSPFSFAIGSGFGSKLWGDVETLWNETLSPTPKTATAPGSSGHAYLDVWGRKVAAPPFDEPEGSRGRDRNVADGQRKTIGRSRGPLVERDGVSTSTTPALSRRTTDTFKEQSRSRNLVSDEGITVLDEILATNKAIEVVETEVFEHIVAPADSLAGVALKYGVTVAQLRKTNKMWASDTIHLRKVLYIPVGASSKKAQPGELIDLTSNLSQINLSANTLSTSGDHHSPKSNSVIDSSPSIYNTTLSGSASTSSLVPSKSISSTPSTKRIPISELSYFPPPSVASTTIFTSNPHPSTISSGTARKWDIQNGVSSSSLAVDSYLSGNSRANSPSRNGGIASSIFHVFPSLNEITSRASFDTVRSVGSLPGSGNVSGEDDMELDEMRRRHGYGVGSMPSSRGMKKRVKVRPRVVGDEGGGGKGKVITQQLAPRSMELPSLQASGSSSAPGYGEGWADPDA